MRQEFVVMCEQRHTCFGGLWWHFTSTVSSQRGRGVTDSMSDGVAITSLFYPSRSRRRRYYTAATVTPMKELMTDALIMARKHNFDVFNALDILENSTALLRDLKFGVGDGNLHYYLYNWHLHSKLEPHQVGLILM